jgi:hypothetical protein
LTRCRKIRLMRGARNGPDARRAKW